MIIPKDIYSHPAITRIFASGDDDFRTNKAKLQYSRKCYDMCVERELTHTAAAWKETIEALEEAVFSDSVAFGEGK